MSSHFLEDIIQTFLSTRLISYLAISDTRARYRRSIIGPWWLTLGTGIGVLGLGIVWSSLLNLDPKELIPKLAIGLIIWQFLSSCIVESPALFIRQAQIIRNYNLPYLIHPLLLLIRQLITLAHNLVILAIVTVLFPNSFSSLSFFGILGLCLVIANMLWIIVILGIIGARFRDTEPLLQSIMPLLFFVTPVIYEPSRLGLNQIVLWFNPLTYFIEVVRAPFFGQIPSFYVYAGCFAILIVGWSLAYFLFKNQSPKLSFWI
jgi:ABC-type polysaccharide/polyol phosphate export permease